MKLDSIIRRVERLEMTAQTRAHAGCPGTSPITFWIEYPDGRRELDPGRRPPTPCCLCGVIHYQPGTIHSAVLVVPAEPLAVEEPAVPEPVPSSSAAPAPPPPLPPPPPAEAPLCLPVEGPRFATGGFRNSFDGHRPSGY